MSLFQMPLEVKPDQIDALQDHAKLLLRIVENVETDEEQLFLILRGVTHSVEKYARELKALNNIDIKTGTLPSLDKVRNLLMEKINELSNALIEFSDDFELNYMEKLTYSEDHEQIAILDEFKIKAKKYLGNVNDAKKVCDKKNEMLKLYDYNFDKTGKKMVKHISSRLHSFTQTALIKEECVTFRDVNTMAQLNHEKKWDAIKGTITLKGFEGLQKILDKNLERHQKVLTTFFDELKRKFLIFLGDLKMSKELVLEKFSPETDATQFAKMLFDDIQSKSLAPMNEILNPHDLKTSEIDIFESIEDTLKSMDELCKSISTAHCNFMSEMEVDQIDVTLASSMTERIKRLSSALRDTFCESASVFDAQREKLKVFAEVKRKWQKKAQNFYLQNSVEINKIEHIASKDVPNVTGMAGFDANFVAALENSKSTFVIDNLGFEKNDENDAREVLASSEKALDLYQESPRIRLLRGHEVVFSSFVVWVKNSFVALFDALQNNSIESKGIFMALDVFVKRCTVLNVIPAVHEHTKENKMFRELISEKKDDKDEKKDVKDGKGGAETDKDEQKEKNVKLFESFVGKDEIEKGKKEAGKNDMNFFSYLMDTYDTGESQISTFNVAMFPTEKEPTHDLHINKDERTIEFESKNNKGQIDDEFKISDYHVISINRPSLQNGETYFKKITFGSKAGESKNLFFHGDEEELIKLRGVITKNRTRSPINSKIAQSCLEFDVTCRQVERKSLSHFKIKTNMFWSRMFVFSGVRFMINTTTLFSEFSQKKMSFFSTEHSSTYNLRFVNYQQRDATYHIIRKMQQNESRCVNPTFDVFVGALPYDRNHFSKLKWLKNWLPKDQHVYIFNVFGSTNVKSIEDISEKVAIQLGKLNSFQYKSTKVFRGALASVMVFIKKNSQTELNSFSFVDRKTHLLVSMSLSDIPLLIIVPYTRDLQEFKAITYEDLHKSMGPIGFPTKKTGKKCEDMSDLTALYENVFWVCNFKSQVAEKPIKAAGKDDDNKKTWKKDMLNVCYANHELFEGYRQVLVEKNAPLSKDKSNPYPMRIFYKNNRSDSDCKFLVPKTYKDNDSGLSWRPSGANFRIRNRMHPINFAVSKEFQKTDTEFGLEVTDFKVTPDDEISDFSPDDESMVAILKHNSCEHLFVSFPRNYDPKEKTFVWKRFWVTEEGEKNDKRPMDMIFYVRARLYIEETFLTVSVGNKSVGHLASGTIGLSAGNSKDEGKKFSTILYKNGYRFGSATGRMRITSKKV